MCVCVYVFCHYLCRIQGVFQSSSDGHVSERSCTSYLACLSFLCGEICKTERIKHTLGGCHSAKPKFWLSSLHRSATVTQKVFHISSQICISNPTQQIWSLFPLGRNKIVLVSRVLMPTPRVVIQGSVMVSCQWVLLLATKAMLEQFQMSCFGGSKFNHPINLDACCTSCYLTPPISSGPRLLICMHFVSGIFITKHWNNIPLL